MHKLRWRPDEIYALPPETKKFIYESILFQIETEDEHHQKYIKDLERRRNK